MKNKIKNSQIDCTEWRDISDDKCISEISQTRVQVGTVGKRIEQKIIIDSGKHGTLSNLHNHFEV